jgi:hypothetical protein
MHTLGCTPGANVKSKPFEMVVFENVQVVGPGIRIK